MIGFLRRSAPRHPVLAVLYWVALLVAVLAALFVAFWFLDDHLPGAGQF